VMKILLVQVRASDDIMLEHEVACIERKLSPRSCTLVHHNAVVTPADPAWLDGVDAMIIGGSGDFSVHHPRSLPWVTPLRHVLEEALKRNMPGFGVCFGHQVLGQHLGSQVITDPDASELGTVDVSLTDAGRASPLYAGFNDVIRVHSGHSDRVQTVPEGVELLAENGRCETQSFRVRGTQFYSVQFHPDMTGAEARYRYLAYREGFADRIDGEARKAAERFIEGDDESTELLGRFVDILASP